MVHEYLLTLGLPGVAILALGYAVNRLYVDLQKTQNARVDDLRSQLLGDGAERERKGGH